MSAVRFEQSAHHGSVWCVSAGHRLSVVRGRVELPTFRFSGGRSYRLSYLTAVLTGFEPATSTLTGWRALRAALQDLALVNGTRRVPPEGASAEGVRPRSKENTTGTGVVRSRFLVASAGPAASPATGPTTTANAVVMSVNVAGFGAACPSIVARAEPHPPPLIAAGAGRGEAAAAVVTAARSAARSWIRPRARLPIWSSRPSAGLGARSPRCGPRLPQTGGYRPSA